MAASDRLRACKEALASLGVARFVGFAGRIHNFLVGEPVLTLTGFRGAGDCAVVIAGDGSVSLVVSPAWDAARAAREAPDVRVIASDDLIGGLASVLGPSAPDESGRMGVAGLDLLPNWLADKAGALVGPAAIGLDRMIRELGQCKTADEIDDARAATRIAELGYEHLKSVLRPGMSEIELSAELYCHMKGLGSEDNFLLMSSSQHNHAVRTPLRRILAEGDIVLVELTPCVNGQFSQICRTICVGQPAPILSEKFAILQQAMEHGIQAARPGRPVSDASAAMNRVFEAAGYGRYCHPPYMRVRGHGLGVVSDLPGDLDDSNDTVLREGMVFIIHPNQYIPETGYLMCGEPVCIGPDGAEPLTRASATLDFVAV